MKIRYGLACLALSAAAVQAQEYFDFDQLPGIAGEPSVQIDLNPAMLGFVKAAAAASEDPEAAQLLEGIEGIRVRVYEHLADPAGVVEFIDRASQTMEGQGWQRSVYVQDEGERVRIYMRFDDTRMSGLTVMVTDDTEAVFISVAGQIDPAVLGRVAGPLGIDGILDGLGEIDLNKQAP